MNKIALRCLGTIVLASALCGRGAAAEADRRGPQGDTYESIAQMPDWSGVWIIPDLAFAASIQQDMNPMNPAAPRLRPEYAKVLMAVSPLRPTGPNPSDVAHPRANAERCLPIGMPDIMRYPAAIEFLFTPGRVSIVMEEGPSIRRIYTDGRARHSDGDTTYMGESLGAWDGTTLVVETKAISPKAQFIGPVRTSGQARVIERIWLKDADHLQIDTVVEDPGVLLAPWRYTRVYERLHADFVESVCMENNRELEGSEPDLTPPN